MADIRSKERGKIIVALREADQPLSIAEIMEATEIEKEKRNNTDKLLSKMVDDGEIAKITGGRHEAVYGS
jgi:predicted Zn-ribbon and HTH transcriptional regulator